MFKTFILFDTGDSLERSASSTNPHNVSIYADAQEFPAPVVQIAPTRHGITANSVMSNPDYYVETSDSNASVMASSSNRNDVIT